MLDFATEFYVRLYTRDTTSWNALGWEGQCLLPLLLRKADRAGIIPIGKRTPARALAALLHGPLDFIEVGITRLIEEGAVVHRGDDLVLPRFIEAQESVRPDAVRQRQRRQRRREEALGAQATLPSMEHLCPEPAPEKTQDNQDLEDTCHEMSRLAKLSKVKDLSSKLSEQAQCQPESNNVVQLHPLASPPRPTDYTVRDLGADFSRLRKAAGGAAFDGHGDGNYLKKALAWARRESPSNPREACLRSIGNFLASAWHGDNGGWSFRTWSRNSAGWSTSRPKRTERGPAAASTRAEHTTNGANPDWLSDLDLEAAQ